MVARRVEAADLGRDIGPEGAVARDEREERQHKQLLERQACLQRAGSGNGIESINLRCEVLQAEGTKYAFEHIAHSAEPDDAAMAGQQ
jgi:hypothetical protein